jgi:hypothetical protein
MAIGLGGGAGALSGWFNALADDVGKPSQQSVILLWLAGGASTIDLWDLKPGHANGGPFREINTPVAGMRISEHLPQLAAWGADMAIVRSLTSKEGDHGRATRFVKTGYLPQGAIHFPAIGSLVAHEIGNRELDLPNYVSVARSNNSLGLGGGFLGPQYSPLSIAERAQNATPSATDLKVSNLSRPEKVSATAQSDRLALLHDLEVRFAAGRTSPVVASLQDAHRRATRMMKAEAAAAFDLDSEPDALRDRYGRNLFGQGCLLARRLVERGVSFVEVSLDGWDTHDNNFERVKGLSTTLDAAFATLLTDLRQRGLLESTLILCLSEFGRTPKINGGVGRDHWPSSWSAALAGGKIRGGQVIGRTSADGLAVKDRPVTVPDLIATTCCALGIDPKKQNMSNVARPIRVADPAAEPIKELL